MSEHVEEPQAEEPDFRRYLSIAKRRQMQFIVPLFLGWLVVWGASWFMEPKYKSSTLILVEEPSMPSTYVQPNVSDDLQTRLQSLTQQIMSSTRLLTIINKLNLYQDGNQKRTDDDRVQLMRKDITVELVRDARNNQVTAFRIFYTSNNPRVAQEVTSDLKDLFISETLRERQRQSEGTTKFLQSQLEEASKELALQESKVHAYEATHEGALPSQSTSNLQILSGLQSQLQNQQDALNSARQQRTLLQSQIQQYRTAPVSSRNPDGAPSGLSALDLQLTQLRAQLVDLSSKYTESYPDVKKVKDQIAETQRMRDQLAASEKSRAGQDSQPAPGSPLAQLESQLQANKLEISNREQSIANLETRINGYEGRLNATPGTEQQLGELNRGYEQLKANYDDLLKKENESEMATSMEQTQRGERFSMLDPPSLPVKPDFPNRLKFCGMGIGLGVVLGLLVAGLMEFLDDRLHSEKEIKAQLPVAVVAEIPEVVSPNDQAGGKNKQVLNWTMTAAAVLVMLVAAAVSYLRG